MKYGDERAPESNRDVNYGKRLLGARWPPHDTPTGASTAGAVR
jgi:hypothetical protein